MRLIYVVFILFLMAAPVPAQDPGPDTIGLWFDAEGVTNVIADPSVGLLFHGYLIIHAPSHDQIGGVEVAIDVPDGVEPLALELPPGGYNYGGSMSNLVVAWYPALDGDPDLMFLTITYLVVSEPTLPSFFVLGPTSPTSFPETQTPGYGYWEGTDVPLVPLGYVFDDPAHARFEPGTVAVENLSLTAVKDLFD